MLKRSKLLVAAVAMMIVGTGPAGAALTTETATALYVSVPAYRTDMYSDAAKTILVGSLEPDCKFRPDIGPYVEHYLIGAYGEFTESHFVYNCGPYGAEPI